MQRILHLLLAITPVIFALAQFQSLEELEAVRFVGQMESGRFEECMSMMDGTMKKALPVGKLQVLWDSLEGQAGPFVSIEKTRRADQGNYHITLVTCRFGKGLLDVKVVLDMDGRVAGLFFLPSGPQAKPRDPPHADKSKFTEEETAVVTGDYRLPATLTLPRGAAVPPVVVLVHGSGSNDRDETIGPNKVFRDLTWGLAMRGIASLRYEKRTREYLGKLGNVRITPREEAIDDAISAACLMAGDSRVDGNRVVVVGHSLGGRLAPLIAEEAPEVDAIVIMAGATRPMLVMMREQIEYILKLDGSLSEPDRTQLSELDTSVAKLRKGELTGGLLAGLTKPYLDAFNAIDAPGVAKGLSIPVYVTQGKRDYQVNAEKDFKEWKRILRDRPNVTFKLYDKLDHLFMEGEGPSAPSDYQMPRNVSEQFISDLAGWILKLPKRQAP